MKKLIIIIMIMLCSLFYVVNVNTTNVGKEPGLQSLLLYGSNDYHFYINITNSRNDIPTNEWIFFSLEVEGILGEIFCLKSNGEIVNLSLVDLEYATHDNINHDQDFIYLGHFTINELDIAERGKVFIYGYAYRTVDIIIENMVRLRDP